ncbi:hypothetical protein SEVIR_9G093400v4 [Setaria viridis]|nr:uncharacterized protein LOC101777146 [Setaria italica]XP_034571199.1 FCS-Like Zinc finger 8-like [Setaria viridis]RCV40933.1 hypothetical protein SETIT_9G094900v2 [Setaria italica]TKV91391.1 hypothetical protein SEVIR_9G093400v2 [Setaria viridis]
MFLRSKIQEMILRRRSRSMNSGAAAQRGHASDQLASSSTVPCDGDSAGAGGRKSATARALFASPRLLHSSSLPTGTVFAKGPVPDAESETAFSMSPTSVLDAAASFRSGTDAAGSSRRRPWRDNALHGLADALDCGDQQPEGIVLAATSPSLLVRSCSLDRRVEFGVKNKSSWLPLRACSGREATPPAPADPWEMEPSSEDYTCVISRGPNPRTVHIFGDRVVEAGAAEASAAESSPRPINLPARGDRGFLSL